MTAEAALILLIAKFGTAGPFAPESNKRGLDIRVGRLCHVFHNEKKHYYYVFEENGDVLSESELRKGSPD
jgi:hypothetical protein